MNAGAVLKEREGVGAFPSHTHSYNIGNHNYRLHTSQTLKHTSTAGDQSLGTDSIELSTQPIRRKDFLFLSLGFSPKSTPKDLYYICLTANTLSRSIQSVLFCSVWVFESFCVCVGHCMSLISAVTDDVTLGDLKCYGHASSHNTAVQAYCDRLRKIHRQRCRLQIPH